ncbi:LexA family protein [Chryseobacterium oncorhynchi]|uniref:Peptidase S24/S26A/S26B/S26C domain-containing protein n=1 Tax=Chryseobacterium oncorhynchi TaxID=741074 RepID=A0A316WH59_9FLAO|nr:S24 family peptidase [Chryseobacterium oncorhynchi]PWN59556.1 hypothetical protein C1638_021375 [Chryseobacterium oncorhynchi]
MNLKATENGKLEIFKFSNTQPIILLPFNEPLKAGGYQSFSSPAEDFPDMDLFQFLIRDIDVTVPARIQGDCLSDIGVYDKDWAIIEKGIEPNPLDLVAVYIDGEHYIKRFKPKYGDNNRLESLKFQTANKDYPDFDINEDTEFVLWGVIIGIVRKYR